MKNVTYLLGAGASAQALPTTDSIRQDLQELTKKDNNEIEALINTAFKVDPREAESRKLPWLGGTYGGTFTAGLVRLRDSAEDHPSLDTFARMLYFKTGDPNSSCLINYKAIIACYLMLRQIHRRVDQRYEMFFASVLQRDPHRPTTPFLPPNLRIMAWNYDLQLEKALWSFTTDPYHVISTITGNRAAVLRLNGSCIPEGSTPEDFLPLLYDGFSGGTIDDLSKVHDAMTGGRLRPGIRFAWENDGLKDTIKDFVRETEVLVVVGYSFPYFNREIDKTILHAMKDNRLETVYVQSKEDQAETIERIRARLAQSPSTREVGVKPTAGVNQFFIPSEIE
jgi:hypothetical protein